MVKSEVEVDRPELSLRESVFLATFKMFLMCRCSKCFCCTIKFRFARSTESNFDSAAILNFHMTLLNYIEITKYLRASENGKIV
jgi:hypothetical protein